MDSLLTVIAASPALSCVTVTAVTLAALTAVVDVAGVVAARLGKDRP